MNYRHQYISRIPAGLPLGKVVCAARTYGEHARELGNPVPEEPVIFMKPSTALVPLEDAIVLPEGQGECHYEGEIALLIGRRLHKATADNALNGVVGVGIGLDLTLRALQDQLKAEGLPWEKAKAFDGACPLSNFMPARDFPGLTDVGLELKVNGEVRQSANSRDMLVSMVDLLVTISQVFTLLPGDVVLTGTPSGVGPLAPGDELEISIPGHTAFHTRVAG